MKIRTPYPDGMPVVVDLGTISERRGRVIAYTFAKYQGRPGDFVYVVQLAPGFYSEDRHTFVSVLTVHPDNLEPDGGELCTACHRPLDEFRRCPSCAYGRSPLTP